MHQASQQRSEGLILSSSIVESAPLDTMRRGGGLVPQITWEDAEARLHGVVKPPDLVSNLITTVRELGGEALGFPVIVSYRYGEEIFQDGAPQWPRKEDGTPGDAEDCATPDGLCLGIILQNRCEVQSRARRLSDPETETRAPEALIDKGQWLGLFEVLNAAMGVGEVTPNYTIRAGATAMYALLPHADQRHAKLLSKAYSAPPPGNRKCPTFQFIQNVIAQPGFAPDWSLQVLFFPPKFIEALVGVLRAPIASLPQSQLALSLLKTGWRRQELVRGDYKQEFYDALKTGAQLYGAQLHHDALQAASNLCSFLVRANADAIPLFCPCNTEDGGGPFDEVTAILSAMQLPRLALRAKYATIVREGDEYGYYSLHDIHDEFFDKDKSQEHLNRAVQYIRYCYRKVANQTDNIVLQHKEIFDNAMFRVDKAASTQERTSSQYTTLRINPSAKPGERNLLEVADPAAFWSPRILESLYEGYTSDKDREDRLAAFMKSRHPLFSHAVRVERRQNQP